MAEISGNPVGSGRRIAVVVSRFNETVTRPLVDGALDALVRHGVAFDDIDIIWVPGAWELPLAARHAMASDQYEAIVALGAVIRGDTPHFEYVAGECARGLMDAGLATGVPVIFGVLTTETQAQAEERADISRMNKGRESMEAALEMIELLAPFGAPRAKPQPQPKTRKAAPKTAPRKKARR